MLSLRSTERAVTHREAIVDHISLTSPVYADGVVFRIEQRRHVVCDYPQLGKVAREAGRSCPPFCDGWCG